MMLKLTDLGRIYESTGAGLQNISAEIPAGQWVGLLGPSGSGKSTLLRLVSGLEQPSSGTLEVPFAQTEISFMFQEPALMPWKTVMENILLPLSFRKNASLGEARARADQWIKKLRLQKFADRYPEELSGGMKMRVSLARALITEPKLLLLDEPFSSLDEPIRIELGLELRELWKQSKSTVKTTVMMVTHSITEALWLSDRIVVFQGQPGTAVLDEVLPFGVDRPLSMRGSPEFLSRVEKCFHLLKGGEK